MKCICQNEMKVAIIQKEEVLICESCGWMKKTSFLSAERERKRYDAHVVDEGYKAYLRRLYEMIKEYIVGNSYLDYGCGKIHYLADICIENCYSCDYYDLYYYPICSFKKYDTIFLIEVFEHLDNPYEELLKLHRLLKRNGRIIIVTQPYDGVDLSLWWYFRDITHRNFILKNTLRKWPLPLRLIEQKGNIFVLECI